MILCLPPRHLHENPNNLLLEVGMMVVMMSKRRVRLRGTLQLQQRKRNIKEAAEAAPVQPQPHPLAVKVVAMVMVV